MQMQHCFFFSCVAIQIYAIVYSLYMGAKVLDEYYLLAALWVSFGGAYSAVYCDVIFNPKNDFTLGGLCAGSVVYLIGSLITFRWIQTGLKNIPNFIKQSKETWSDFIRKLGA